MLLRTVHTPLPYENGAASCCQQWRHVCCGAALEDMLGEELVAHSTYQLCVDGPVTVTTCCVVGSTSFAVTLQSMHRRLTMIASPAAGTRWRPIHFGNNCTPLTPR